ncbi:MAG: YggS family pyridoxal phosphate-dependent enzyme [Burkholderiales bacterium]|nr:YggS family pyridoxal phosphate-dependent enzyme [Burkholderiales bacterium]
MRIFSQKCGKNSNDITVLPVSKRFSVDAIRAVYALGLRSFGENYVQEAEEKRRELSDLSDLSWVLIGSLQKNKARLAAEVFDRIETVAGFALAQKLSAARSPLRKPLEVLIQVNISGEPQKSGVLCDDALPLAREVAALPRLKFRGFMGVAENTDDSALRRRQFARLQKIFEDARKAGLNPDMLSMGMSADMEDAIAEGSTELRIGTAIFGERTVGK